MRGRHDRIAVIGALLVPPAIGAVLTPVRASVPNTDAALVLVAFVVAIAAFGNRAAGYLATFGAVVWFDFFLTVPYERLAITRRNDIQTAVLLLLVGMAVSELAVSARRRGRVVAADEALLAVTQSTAGLVARGESAQAVADQVCVQLQAVLGARACTFERSSVQPRGLRLEPDGSVRWGAALWDLAEHGFPDEKLSLPARYGGEVHGRFVLTPIAGTAPSLQARRSAVVLADLTGAAAAAGSRRTM